MVDDVVRLVQVFTPLLVAIASGIWVVYKYIESRREKVEEAEVGSVVPVQGQPIVAEWTWQDELKDARGRLEDAGLREDAFREALVLSGVSPRGVLEQAGLIQPLHRVPLGAPKQRPGGVSDHTIEEDGPKLYLLAAPPSGSDTTAEEDFDKG